MKSCRCWDVSGVIPVVSIDRFSNRASEIVLLSSESLKMKGGSERRARSNCLLCSM